MPCPQAKTFELEAAAARDREVALHARQLSDAAVMQLQQAQHLHQQDVQQLQDQLRQAQQLVRQLQLGTAAGGPASGQQQAGASSTAALLATPEVDSLLQLHRNLEQA